MTSGGGRNGTTGAPRVRVPERGLDLAVLGRRVLLVVVLIGLVAAPVALRFDLAAARRDRDHARAASAAAATGERAAAGRVADGATTLAAREADAHAAAQAVDEARSRLADTGVSERAVRDTLDKAGRAVDLVEAESTAMSEQLRLQAAMLPQAGDCVDEMVRMLTRAARAAVSGEPVGAASTTCRTLERTTPHQGPTK